MNNVILNGTITKDIEISHTTEIENFYKFILGVKRLSGQVDEIPIIVSDRLINPNQSYLGKKVKIEGNYRSYNQHTDDKVHLILSVFAQNISFNDDEDENTISISGSLCKDVVFRTTPLGREIADILVAVNRLYDKADYIPCVAWGRNARYLRDNYNKSDSIEITGRIQSRKYIKNDEEKTAYEVSVISIN